jgi:hypothetical protein
MSGDALDRCFAYARKTARQGKMKGLDPKQMGHAFMAEALISTFEVDAETAMQMSLHCIAYAAEYLNTINRQNVEVTGGDLAAFDRMLEEATADNPAWMKTDPALVSIVHRTLGKPDLFNTTAVKGRSEIGDVT